MKTQITSVLPLLVVFCSLLVISCRNEESADVDGKVFYDAGSKQSFRLDDQSQLNQVAALLAQESAEFNLLKDASVVEMKDSQGNFKAISVSYQVGDNVTKLVVPIVEVPSEKNGVNYYVVEDCLMRCTSSASCDGSTQTIIKRCASQTCACSGGSGDADSSIAFKD